MRNDLISKDLFKVFNSKIYFYSSVNMACCGIETTFYHYSLYLHVKTNNSCPFSNASWIIQITVQRLWIAKKFSIINTAGLTWGISNFIARTRRRRPCLDVGHVYPDNHLLILRYIFSTKKFLKLFISRRSLTIYKYKEFFFLIKLTDFHLTPSQNHAGSDRIGWVMLRQGV